jgi:hypothetical protein
MNGSTGAVQQRRRSVQSGAKLADQVTGDFNGDGKSGILWADDDGTPAIWPIMSYR